MTDYQQVAPCCNHINSKYRWLHNVPVTIFHTDLELGLTLTSTSCLSISKNARNSLVWTRNNELP